MMKARTIATTLDELEAWVSSEIAPKLTYMIPFDEDQAIDTDELPAIQTGNPSVYQAFVPGRERLADGQLQAPSIAVQLLSGKDGQSFARTLSIRLVLTIWSPGHFDESGYHRDHDGWRDLYNGLDTMAVAVKAVGCVAGCTVDHARGVDYGYLDIDGEIPDLYPYWVGKLDFDLIGASPANNRFESLL